jgi:hypothetical protein
LNGSVPQLAHSNLFTHQAKILMLLMDLEVTTLPTHRPVPLHDSLLLPAEHFIQVPRKAPMHVSWLGWLHAKPPVQIRQKCFFQEDVGLGHLIDLGQSQLFDQAVLQ